MTVKRALTMIKGSALALVAALSLVGGARAEGDGLVGQPLAAAKASELFTWFHMEQTGERPCGGGRFIGFRPSGEQFRPLASIGVATDARGVVAAMTLTLDRGFIDDPANGVFARDIAKSFLRGAAGSKAPAPIATLADELEAGMASGAIRLHPGAGGPADRSGPPSAGGQVFLGLRPAYALEIGGPALTLANGRQGVAAVLRITLSTSGAASACAANPVAD
jgi:hypothetical protein